MDAAIACQKLFDGDSVLEDRGVILDAGLISAVCSVAELPRSMPRVEVPWVTAGFIDLQVNGGGDVLLNDDTSSEAMLAIAAAHRRFGTTQLLPTLVSSEAGRLEQCLRAAREAVAVEQSGCLGLHLEGPFLNPAKKGAHAAEYLRPAGDADLDLICDRRSLNLLITLAPECVTLEQLERLREAGVTVFAGHTNATCGEIRPFGELIRGFTHLYNAMSQTSSREPGAVGAALDMEHAFASAIMDGLHVDPANLRVAHRVKKDQKGKLFLITDAMSTVGGTRGYCELYGERIELAEGILTNREGVLAGAHLSMDLAVRNAVEFLGIDWEEAFRMASLYPARALGLDDRYGRVRAGCTANLTLLDGEGRVVGTVVDGRITAE